MITNKRGWLRAGWLLVGLDGAVVGIARFGTSAPGDEAMSALGIDSDAVVEAVRRVTAA